MKKIYSFFVITLITLSSFSQTATFIKWPDGIVPVIDGVADAIWLYTEVYEITNKFKSELPTLNPGTGFSAAWNDTAIFVIVYANDDYYCDRWCSGATDWLSDKPEIYFDVNDVLHDGIGASTMYTGIGTGHYQFAPGPDSGFDAGFISGVHFNSKAGNWVYQYAYVITDPTYIYEYAIRINKGEGSLTKKDGSIWVPYISDSILFECTVIDRDPNDTDRNRANWHTPEGAGVDEAWNNMDVAGFVRLDEFYWGISNKEISQLTITPNPAKDFINIDAKFDEVVITNVLGQKVKTILNIKSSTIDISDIQSGFYVVSVFKDEKLVGTGKVVIKYGYRHLGYSCVRMSAWVKGL